MVHKNLKSKEFNSPFILMDRDGTLIKDKHYISKVENVEFFEDSKSFLKILKEIKATIIIVSNQSGINRGFFKENSVHQINNFIQKELDPEKEIIKDWFYCPHKPEDECSCRKPEIGLFTQISQNYKFKLNDLYMVGDRYTDIKFGIKIKSKTFLIKTGKAKDEIEKTAKEFKNKFFICENLENFALEIRKNYINSY